MLKVGFLIMPRRSYPILFLLMPWLLVCEVMSAWCGVYNYRLNADSKALSSITDFWLSPDGRWVVYRREEVLYSMPAGGGDPTQLVNKPPAGYSETYDLPQISPDSRTIVFIRQYYKDSSNSHNNLYSVPISGGVVTTLTTTLADYRSDYSKYGTWRYKISPDGKRIAYVNRANELWSIPAGGGVAVRLTRNPDPDYKLSPDSKWVVCRQSTSSGGSTLYRVPLGGGSPQRLIPASAEDSYRCYDFSISADGQKVVYNFNDELRCVPMAGGPPVLLDNGGINFSISPDSKYVAYLKCYKSIYVPSGNLPGYRSLYEIYCKPLVGGSPIRLNPSMKGNGTVEMDFTFTSDSKRLIFRANINDYLFIARSLYSAPVGGGTAADLTGSGSIANSFKSSSNGMKVVYLDASTSVSTQRVRLYSISAAGGKPIMLLERIVPRGSLDISRVNYQISADGSRVIFDYQQNELMSMPIDGGKITRIDQPAVHNPAERLKKWYLSPDGRSVLMLGDLEDSSVDQIYRNATAGGTATRLNNAVYAPYDVDGFRVSPNGRWVVYQGEGAKVGVKELFSVPVSGGTVVRLFKNASTGLFDWQISPDSRRVVCSTGGFLYSTPIQGGPLIQLYPSSPTAENPKNAGSFEITPDSSKVVYLASEWEPSILDYRHLLYCSPISGGVPVKLAESPTSLIDSYSIHPFQVTPDGRNVVYVVKNSAHTYFYCNTLTGGTPVQIAAYDYDYSPYFLISPDSQSVVFRYNSDDGYTWLASWQIRSHQTVQLFKASKYFDSLYCIGCTSLDNTLVFYRKKDLGSYTYACDLFSVPVSGGTPIQLNPVPLSSIQDQQYAITPDGQRVVYLADLLTKKTVELFSVPVTGGASIRISQPLPQNTNVSDFRVSPDGKNVAYVTNPQGNNRNFELFLAAADGHSSVKLDNINSTRGSVIFLFSGNGKNVTYLTDSDLDGSAEIYQTPIQGGSRILLTDNPHGMGARGDMWTNNDGSLTVYCADQGTGGIHLFASCVTNGVDWKSLNLYQ